MAGERTGQHEARARLVLMGQEGRPPERGSGWVPQGPAADDTDPAPLRGRAITSALRTYSATYGHPLEHPTVDTEPVARRWATNPRVVVAALAVLALICAAVVARGAARLPSTTVDLGLPATGASTGDGGGAAGRSTGTETGAPGDLGGGAPGLVAAPDLPGDGPPEPGVATVPPEGAVAGETASEPVVVVHVVGQVVTPGVVTLPVGSRVVDALAAAGGPTADADLSVVNLARVVVDGEQVLVPRPGEPPPPPPPSAGASGTDPAVVDLNTADVAALDTLPGIGPVLAQRIVDWRTDHGRFTTVEELGEVQGIGPALLAGLREAVRV